MLDPPCCRKLTELVLLITVPISACMPNQKHFFFLHQNIQTKRYDEKMGICERSFLSLMYHFGFIIWTIYV